MELSLPGAKVRGNESSIIQKNDSLQVKLTIEIFQQQYTT